MVSLSNGLPSQAGSVNRLSPFPGTSVDRPAAIAPSSLPNVAAREATVRGWRARFIANRGHDMLGATLSARPNTGLVSNRSSGTANSSKSSASVVATLLYLLGHARIDRPGQRALTYRRWRHPRRRRIWDQRLRGHGVRAHSRIRHAAA